MNAEVLIVGAGPTGLMLANQLVRQGVNVLIVERNAAPARETRALGVQARTLEIYAQLGIATRAIELGKKGTGAVMWADGRRRARIPLGSAGAHLTPFPFILVLGQDDNEALLGARLREQGVDVQWGTELVALHETAGGVAATLRTATGERVVNVAYVAGCDGAHSAVRHLTGIAFPGAPYEHVFYVADVEITGPMVADEVNILLWRSGFHLLFPMRGKDHWRIVGIVPTAQRDDPHVTMQSVLPDLQQKLGETFAMRNCSWFATYRIHHRKAVNFRKGRAFLLGDAAHIHSPVGAQGMNTGLQDAYNLGWKLGLVIRHGAGDTLLDTYAEEREAVARRLLQTTDRAFRLAVADGPLAGLLRTQVVARIGAFLMGRQSIQARAFGVVSQIGIHYRGASLSRSLQAMPPDAPQPGDRFPWLRAVLAPDAAAQDLYSQLNGIHFALVVVGQPAVASLGQPGVDVIVIPSEGENVAMLAAARIPPVCWYLVRPDGYIGTCGVRLQSDPIRTYMGNLAAELH